MALTSWGSEQGGEDGMWIWRGNPHISPERTAVCCSVLAARRKRRTFFERMEVECTGAGGGMRTLFRLNTGHQGSSLGKCMVWGDKEQRSGT